MYQHSVFTRSSESRGLLMHFQDDEAAMARRFHDLAVVERRSPHHCVVELSNGLRDHDVSKVEDGSNVTFLINRVKVQGVAFLERDVEPGWVKCINEDQVVVPRDNSRGEVSEEVGGFSGRSVHGRKQV
jgi:hypothetical protein